MEAILSVQNISKSYKQQIALDSISLQINKGDVYGLIGLNGAGKTTFLRAISGLIRIDSGGITLFSNADFKKELWRAGFVIEKPFLYLRNTVKENLTIYCKLLNVDTSRISEVLSIVGLSNQISKKADDLSFGMKQKLNIAMALIKIPELLVLDEPLNGLDVQSVLEFRDLIKNLNENYGITFIVSSHILSELEEVATRYGILKDGQLIHEGYKSEFNESITLEDIFREKVGVKK
ncbi:MAG: ATP-binding cassette domain-containing protein [Oscillospiraceae bacterium]|nr:ATP-binding cassette domain-containing protein [Oscillospiraceae bacterium]